MAVRIRLISTPKNLQENDAHTLRVIQEQCFGQTFIPMEDMDESYWWIAFDGKMPVGCSALTIWVDRRAAFLSMACVIPGYRGQKLQLKMIKVRERKAKTILEIDRVISYTSYDNFWSANNLIQAGYLLYEPEYDWGVEWAYYFQKMLPKERPHKARVKFSGSDSVS